MIKILLLFLNFALIGLFTFGGGYAMIPMFIERIVGNGWLTSDELYQFIGIAEATPGSFAVNTATFVGFNQSGVLGALFSTIGVVLPSFIIILLIASFGSKFIKSNLFQKMLKGIRPVVIGAIISITITMMYKNFFNNTFDTTNLDFTNVDFVAIIIFSIVFFLSFIKIKIKGKVFKVTPIMIIIISGLLGILLYMIE